MAALVLSAKLAHELSWGELGLGVLEVLNDLVRLVLLN